MIDLASRIRRIIEDHIQSAGVDFELSQRTGPVFDAVFNGPFPRIDFKGIGLSLFARPTFSDEGGSPIVRYSGMLEKTHVLLYLRSTRISDAED
jgi:hypothetical protein